MRNKLADLNNYLFAQLERLDDENIKGDELQSEIDRSKAITDISAQLISSHNLQLKMLVAADNMGVDTRKPAITILEEVLDAKEAKIY